MVYLVEKVEEYSMNANRMCKGPVAEGSSVRRKAASVAGMGEPSEWSWLEVGLSVCQIKESVFPKDTGEPLEAFKEGDAVIRFVF